MYLNGVRTSEICERLGMPRSTLYWVLKKHGVEPNRQLASTEVPDLLASLLDEVRLMRRALDAHLAEHRNHPGEPSAT